MPTALTIIIAVAGLISTCCGLVLTVRNIQSTSPLEALRKHQHETDLKLDNDNRRLNYLEQRFERMEELDRLLLRSIKGMLAHMADGNHKDTMQKIIGDIDGFLIGR